jgi:hypothetical protein
MWTGSGCVTESADRGATKIPMTKPQIPIKSQIPMTNVQKRVIRRKNTAVESSLGFGHWDLIGIWGLVIGISARQEPPIVSRAPIELVRRFDLQIRAVFLLIPTRIGAKMLLTSLEYVSK